MNRHVRRPFASIGFALALVATTAIFAGPKVSVQAQCPVLTDGLQIPLGITKSNQGNLLVSETGTLTPNTGRISIVDFTGNRRTLLGGLPSGINDVNEPSGPAGLFLRGRTLYVAIGVGDTVRAGPLPGTTMANPNPPSSPIFSSILATHFSDNFSERRTDGFTLSLANQQALASGERVRLSNGGGDRITIKLVANFADFTPNPLATFPANVRASNPFDLVLVGNQERHDGDRERHDGEEDERDRCPVDLLYVTDGGQNLVWQVDVNSGAFSMLAVFPPIPNPLFPTLGGPFEEAVPTGIAHSHNQLLVTLFRGVPFAPSTSVVEQVDPRTGSHSPFITGLKTAIDVLPIREHHDTDYLVLQHASIGPFFGSPGLVLRFETPAGPPTIVANCLNRPTSMTLDKNTLYVTELVTGRIIAITVGP